MERRRSQREGFARALMDCAGRLEGLTKVRIYWEDGDPWNQSFSPGSFVKKGEKDKLSLALRKISQLPALRELDLKGHFCLGKELWEESSEEKENVWPSLKFLRIDMGSTTPDGGWYYTGDPNSEEPNYDDEGRSDWEDSETEYDSDDSDAADTLPEYQWEKKDGMRPQRTFRLTPDDETFGPFMAGMIRATATTRMPKLESLELYIGERETRMDVNYLAPQATLYANPNTDPADVDFYIGRAPFNKPRWLLFLDLEVSNWEFPLEIRDAFAETVGKGCVLVRRYFSGGVVSLNKKGLPKRELL
ncbi:hypothetical protein B0T21DRAFT_375242 [Apiosordaria backusii]|uniref:Uncharacterized protein n=1 Tax=Apiosordaria backusii TaxID=314023 RepID=A0AA40AIT2_9PEZI|nr:hypothetical protein B0T21DRAFT_375242 [Apiosordaria backusii]